MNFRLQPLTAAGQAVRSGAEQGAGAQQVSSERVLYGSPRACSPDIIPPWSEKGVRLAQKMKIGPRIPVEYSYKKVKLAQLLGQLGIFLTWLCRSYSQRDHQICW